MRIPFRCPLPWIPNDSAVSLCKQSGAVEAIFGSLIPNLSRERREESVVIGMEMENSLDRSSAAMIAVQDEEWW